MGCFTKLALTIVNFIVFGAGVAVVVLASLVISKDNTYGVLLREGTFSLPIIVLIFGIIILLIGFLGCCGAMKESKCMLYTYAAIVVVLLIGEIVMGILVLVYSNKSDDVIMDGMDKIFDKYGGNDTALTTSLDKAQQALKCCGVRNYTDWETFTFGEDHPLSLPDGCCKGDFHEEGCGKNILQREDYMNVTNMDGCFYAIKDDAQNAAIGLGVACLILAALQAFSISCACGIAKKSH